MSKYTTQVRFICESFADNVSVEYGDIDSVIERSIDRIFDFTFPIFEASYRTPLCKKILKHYYTREIGFETVGLWKHYLNVRLNEIMPYYNDLYKTTIVEFEPLFDVNITTEHKRTNVGKTDGTNNATNTGDATGFDMYSDTPQGALNNVRDENYLTNATKTTNNFNTTQNGSHNTNMNNTEDFIQTVKGKRGGKSSSKLLKEFRETIINIDAMIIDELSDLFINLW